MLKKKSQVKDKGKIINLKIIVRLVVILVDGLRNYMTKHLSKDWMIENKFLSVNEYNDENCKYWFKGVSINRVLEHSNSEEGNWTSVSKNYFNFKRRDISIF